MRPQDAPVRLKRELLRVSRGCIYRRNLLDGSLLTSCEKTYFVMPQSRRPYPEWCPNCRRNVVVYPSKEEK